jgi:hypothetical protein
VSTVPEVRTLVRDCVRACLKAWWPVLLVAQVVAGAVAAAVSGLGAGHVALVSLLLPAAGGLSVVAHELGHLAVIPRPWPDVAVSGAVAGVAVEHDSRGRWRDVSIAVAGPLAAAACGVLVLLAVQVLGLPGVAALLALPFLVHLAALVPPNRDGATVLRGLRSGTGSTAGAVPATVGARVPGGAA